MKKQGEIKSMKQICETVTSHHTNPTPLSTSIRSLCQKANSRASSITFIFFALGCHFQESYNESSQTAKWGKPCFPKKQETEQARPHSEAQSRKILLTVQILLHYESDLSVRALSMSLCCWEGSCTELFTGLWHF